jgi:hypothetical protein
MSGKRRELSTRLSEKKALQVELVTAKVKGEIAQDDFDVLKASLSTDIVEIETALHTLSTDSDSLAELTADTTRHTIPACAVGQRSTKRTPDGSKCAVSRGCYVQA